MQHTGQRLQEQTYKLQQHIKQTVDCDALENQRQVVPRYPLGSPQNPTRQIVTVANVVTFSRLILTIVFLVTYSLRAHRLFAICCYAFAASTDFLDGQIARRTQTVSWLGKIMDPVLDRVLLFSGVLGLLIAEDIPLWVAIFVIARDVYLAICGLLLQKIQKRPVDVLFIGKVATALLMLGFVDLLIGAPVVAGLSLVAVSWLPGLNGSPCVSGLLIVYAGIICSLITAVLYTKEGICIYRHWKAEHPGERALGAHNSI